MSARTSTITQSEAAWTSDAPDLRPASARAAVYRYLALAFADPVPGAAAALTRQWPIAEAALTVLGLAGVAEVRAAVATLDDDALKRAHLAVFGHAVSKDCPPYGSEYGQAHIFEKTQTLADVAGFYRAFGLALADGVRDRPDHLAFELEFMEFLCLKQALAERQAHGAGRIGFCRKSQRTFLEAHLGFWAFSFAHRLGQRPDPGPFAAWAGLLVAFLSEEMAAMAIERHADPFVNEGSVDSVDDGACAACSVGPGGYPAGQRR